MDSTALPVRRTLTYPPPTTGAGRARANVQVPDEPIGGIELTRVRLFRFLLTNRHVQTVVRVLSVSLFAYVLFDGFFGPQDNQASFSYTAIWQVWWNPVMTISLLLVGRA